MSIIYFLRLIRRHIILLTATPLVMGVAAILLTRKPAFTYSSQTILYTGIASGSTIEMDKSFNYFLTNTAFDNLLNIVNSRETQQEVAVRLLAQHLMLEKPDPKYINEKSFLELRKITPPQILSYIVKNRKFLTAQDSLYLMNDTSFLEMYVKNSFYKKLFPANINMAEYELTVKNLTDLMKSSDTNFVYKLLNYENPHYSLKALSSIKAQRVANSDLIKISYEVDDPGICQQTLAILSQVCLRNYKTIKENRSDEVVKYFEKQLSQANQQLKESEDKLLAFNKSNNIINYYEQSKAVAVVKEDMEVDYNNKKAQLSGLEAIIRRLEDKLNIQQSVQLKSGTLLEKKKQLGDINYFIANAEAEEFLSEESQQKLPGLRRQAELLKTEIKKGVEDLYSYQNTIDGLPVTNLLNEWLKNVIEAENLRAKLLVMDERNREFQQQYSVYAPAGANIKRIEREISVSEQGYLEILHGLNLAKLKLQDNELAAGLKLVDPPYYPLSPVPTKRKLLVLLASLLSSLLVLGIILLMEYFDNTLKNSKKASVDLKIESLGMFPKVYLNPGIETFSSILSRLTQLLTKNINTNLETLKPGKKPKLVLFASMLEKEGKSILAGNTAKEMIRKGKKAIYLNCSNVYVKHDVKKIAPLLRRLLGYQDSRINFESDFLKNPSEYLSSATYKHCAFSEEKLNTKSLTDICKAYDVHPEDEPDYIFIELPALLSYNFPPDLISAADLTILVCRSNREWIEADQVALDSLHSLCGNKIRLIVNGTELQEIEALVGELPKKRSFIRMKLKKVLRFQYYSKNHI
jgi:polysaccharide biosynthesis transport protein